MVTCHFLTKPVPPPGPRTATRGGTTYLLCPELLHQPLLLPQHLVLLTELPQQLLRQRGERKGREDEQDENPTGRDGMQPGHGVGLMGLMAPGRVSNLLLSLQGPQGDTGSAGRWGKP